MKAWRGLTTWGCWMTALEIREANSQYERELRRSERSGMLIGDPLCEGALLALPTRSSGEWRTHSSEWEGTRTPRRELHSHSWPSTVRGAVLAQPARSSGERRTHSSEWEGTYTLRSERHAHRWPSMARGAVLALPTMLRRERHAHS